MGDYATDKKNARFFGLKLNNVNDKALIDKLLSVDNIQSYLKQLIRADIESCSVNKPRKKQQPDT